MRTPLTAVLGIADALQSDEIKDEYIKNLASNLYEASNRLNRVIENLLDMSRLNSGVLALNLDWQNLNDIIQVVIQKLSKSLVSFQFSYSIDPTIHQLIRADFRLLEHAISNILLNATQYAGDHAKINLDVKSEFNKMKIIISDNGRGIPEESIPFIFEKFYRVLGSAPGGTDLGLSIVKSIIELHKGQIKYESVRPHGSRFIIELPIEEQPTAPHEEI